MITKKQYIQIYKYAKHSMNNTLDPRHDWKHAKRVKENAIKLSAFWN
jgi:HD superfamily phosphodiesterase